MDGKEIQVPVWDGVIRLSSNFSDDDMLPDSILALEFHVTDRTIRRWRSANYLPPVGKGPLKNTKLKDLKFWFDAHSKATSKKELAHITTLETLKGEDMLS